MPVYNVRIYRDRELQGEESVEAAPVTADVLSELSPVFMELLRSTYFVRDWWCCEVSCPDGTVRRFGDPAMLVREGCICPENEPHSCFREYDWMEALEIGQPGQPSDLAGYMGTLESHSTG